MSRQLVEHGFNRKRKRILVEGRGACYHLVSRAPFGFYFMNTKGAREQFVKLMWKQAQFCGVEVLAYCVMSNHIHLLVRVPFIESDKISDRMLLERYGALYGGDYVPLSSYELTEVRDILCRGGKQASALSSALKARMGNVTVFMRELKQRYAIWYNSTYDNQGAVWSGRFLSQVIEDVPSALQMVAAYIDLNPVRAEIVDDPKEYLFSSFGSASRGCLYSINGYNEIYHAESGNASIANYRAFLYAKGANSKCTVEGKVGKDQGTICDEKSSSVISLQRKCRQMSRGGALGSRDFVERVFDENRGIFHEKRSSGGRPFSGGNNFYVLRNAQEG